MEVSARLPYFFWMDPFVTHLFGSSAQQISKHRKVFEQSVKGLDCFVFEEVEVSLIQSA